jgi:transmembrane sensor
MTQKEFNSLLGKYLKRQCTPEEEKLIDHWYDTLGRGTDHDLSEPTDETGARLWQQISASTNADHKTPVRQIQPENNTQINWKWVGIAASVSLFIMTGLFFRFQSSQQLIPTIEAISMSGQLAEAQLIQNTDTKMVKPIRLDDGSLVVLQPNSSIQILNSLKSNQREVKLTGEAFFEITRDEKRPFLVYTQGLVTKVLGTSFNIKARQEDNTIVVDVKTGKVAVFLENNTANKTKFFLTPNQQVIYNRDSDRIVQRLQENPQVIITEEEINEMKFDEAPVSQIFEAIEKAYGIDLVYDSETFIKCQLTTRLSNEGLYERLQIICKALGTTYETVGTQVYIQGADCE